MGIGLILELISGAVSAISAFKGTAGAAKTVTTVQTAISTITALAPLVQSFGDGKEVTEADVRAALAGKDAALAELDRVIASKS